MSLSVLQSLLGHAYAETTGRYFRIRSERKTQEYFSTMEYINDTSPVQGTRLRVAFGNAINLS